MPLLLHHAAHGHLGNDLDVIDRGGAQCHLAVVDEEGIAHV
ncbi:hypothetical protein QFZ79_001037 [Arthrobacter sp. V4I6]|nr:hypothetical protein [Arthrobacter sp. V1I7]MDQ0852926.1 hypothetical protein [Arthrobacter sp. V4I6]